MAGSNASNKDAKRQRREASREARRAEERRRQAARRRRSLAIYGGIIVAVLVIGGLIARSALRPGVGDVGAYFPSQGRDHINIGQPHPAYNSNPPTSGWHAPAPAEWGTYRNEIPDEVLVHNLEHGGIWISYKDPGDTNLVDKLEALAKRYPSKIIVAPRPKDDSKVAVAAWEHLLKLDTYDEKRIVEFINAYRNRGPEDVP